MTAKVSGFQEPSLFFAISMSRRTYPNIANNKLTNNIIADIFGSGGLVHCENAVPN